LTRAPTSIWFNRANLLNWRLQLTNKSIPAPRQCLYKARALRRVAQCFANLVNGRVEVVIDINKGVGPEALLQLLAGDDFAVLLE
jgi:hypothetical protein